MESVQPPPVYTEQPKLPVQSILGNLNIRVLKEPRGFIKFLQFIFSICAFATTVGFTTHIVLRIKCSKGGSPDEYSIDQLIEYSFRLDRLRQEHSFCNMQSRLYLQGDFSSDSGFFVAVGVISFLYSIAAVFLYCFLSELYEKNPLVPTADCFMHGVLAFLWLCASSAWANSLTNLKTATSLGTFSKENELMCVENTCQLEVMPSYSKLNISIILGFLNLFLWASNLWFLYKETPYFKKQEDGANQSTNIPPNPQQPYA